MHSGEEMRMVVAASGTHLQLHPVSLIGAHNINQVEIVATAVVGVCRRSIQSINNSPQMHFGALSTKISTLKTGGLYGFHVKP